MPYREDEWDTDPPAEDEDFPETLPGAPATRPPPGATADEGRRGTGIPPGGQDEGDDPEGPRRFDDYVRRVPPAERDWDVRSHDVVVARMRVRRLIKQLNADAPREPVLYSFGGQIAAIEKDAEGRCGVVIMDKARMRYLLSRVIYCYRPVKAPDDRVIQWQEMAPTWMVDDAFVADNMGLPILEGMTTAPTFAPGVALQNERGYCPASRLYYDPPPGLTIPVVPVVPSPAEVASARRMIVEDLLGDFPFDGPAEVATAAAFLLLPFVRGLIDGPTPLHLFEKPSAGTGATLCVEAITTVHGGRPAAGMTAPASDEEMDKRLLAQFRRGERTIFFDNLSHKLDSGSLAMALTGTHYEGRELGKSTLLSFRVRSAWAMSANNPRLSRELTRRTVRVRMDAHMDEPWRRGTATFRHPKLLRWVRENRGELIHAALLLIQAWQAGGRRPAPGSPTLGMFEEWASVMGGILHVAGIPGFLTNLDALYATTDEEGATLRALIGAWWRTHGEAGVRIADLFTLAGAVEPPLDIGDRGERSQKVRLGKIVAALRDRQFTIGLDEVQAAAWGCQQLSLRVTQAGTTQNAQVWKLVPTR